MLAIGDGPIVAAAVVEGWGAAAPAITSDVAEDGEEDFSEYVRDQPLGLPVEEIATILADLPADWVHDRDDWLKVGAAMHHETGGSDGGFIQWETWSRVSPKFDPKEQKATWRSFKGKKRPVTIKTLIKAANQVRARRPLEATDEFDEILGAATSKTSRLTFISPLECASTPSRGYIVKGLLAPGDLACIYGAPGAGKSLIAPHIAYAISQGRSAFGMRSKAGLAWYVAAEDPHGMRGRVSALRLRHGDTQQFLLVDGVSNLLASPSDDLKALRAAVKEQTPAVIVIDTLAMSFPGLEENSAEAMGQVVAAARSLTKYGAAVVLIHHDTKAQGASPRGHSLLNGALDIALQLFPKDEMGIVRGKLSKNRNGTCERDIAFRIATEILGDDDDGDPISVAVVDELAVGMGGGRVKLTASENAALQVLKDLVGKSPFASVSEADWRAACVESPSVSASDHRDSRLKAAKRAFEGLARKGAAIFAAGNVMLRREVTIEPADLSADDPFDDQELAA